MDIQKEKEAFQKFCEENFDFERHEQTYFDEQTQCYENDIGEDTESINMAWSAWKAAKAESHKSASLYQWEINHLAAANQQWRGYAAKAQAVPEGFVLVPKEPTKDTLIEIASVCIGDDFANLDESRELYQAMLAASQEPK